MTLKILGVRGFTLAEVLIALALLGVIAAFTLPKLLNQTANAQRKATYQQVYASLGQAYTRYKSENTLSAQTTARDFVAYLNHIGFDTTSRVDNRPETVAGDFLDCSNPLYTCVRLHSGAILLFDTDNRFGGETNLHFVYFILDTEGRYNEPSLSGNGKGQTLVLYFNGQIKTCSQQPVGSSSYYRGAQQPVLTVPPSSWDLPWATFN